MCLEKKKKEEEEKKETGLISINFRKKEKSAPKRRITEAHYGGVSLSSLARTQRTCATSDNLAPSRHLTHLVSAAFVLHNTSRSSYNHMGFPAIDMGLFPSLVVKRRRRRRKRRLPE